MSKKKQAAKKPVVRKKKAPPTHIKLGYQDFALTLEDVSVDTVRQYGYTHAIHSKISITKMGNPVEQVNTLIHEMLHAICHTQGIKLDHDTEEMVVNNMANGLTGAIRDNPHLIHYILDQLDMLESP